MISEAQVLSHISALDRVPDPESLDLPDVSSTAFLDRGRRPPVTVQTPTRTLKWRTAFVGAIAILVVAVGLAVWLTDDESSDVAADPAGTVERYLQLRQSGQIEQALALFSPELRESERDYARTLAALNHRGEQREPCEEVLTGRYDCFVFERNDYLDAAGLSMSGSYAFVVSDGEITRFDPNVAEYFDINDLDRRFRNWMAEAYPEDDAGMEGSFAQGDLTAAGARIAMQHIEEFVAQSDFYPLIP